MLLFLGVLAGFLLPFQATINTRLRLSKQSTLLSVMITFFIGLFPIIILLWMQNQSLNFPMDTFLQEPLYFILGSILGILFVSGTIFVFQHIGATQTAILPVFGQVLASLIIDQFGLFHATQTSLSFGKIIGTLFVLCGVVGVVTSGNTDKSQMKPKENLLFYQILAILVGVCSTLQTAANSHLGIILNSPLRATYMNFLVGLIILIVLCLIKGENFGSVLHRSPWWSYLGGCIGVVFVLTTIVITPAISTSMTVITTLLGLTIGGIIIETFGLLNQPKKTLYLQTVLSLIVLIIGVAITQFL